LSSRDPDSNSGRFIRLWLDAIDASFNGKGTFQVFVLIYSSMKGRKNREEGRPEVGTKTLQYSMDGWMDGSCHIHPHPRQTQALYIS
jgi:hypothetical protein